MRDNFQIAQNTRNRQTLLQTLDSYVDRLTVGIQWDHHVDFARNLREE